MTGRDAPGGSFGDGASSAWASPSPPALPAPIGTPRADPPNGPVAPQSHVRAPRRRRRALFVAGTTLATVGLLLIAAIVVGRARQGSLPSADGPATGSTLAPFRPSPTMSSGLVLVAGRLISTDGRQVRAWDPLTRTVVWSADAPCEMPIPLADPTQHSERVFVRCNDRETIAAFEVSTGHRPWPSFGCKVPATTATWIVCTDQRNVSVHDATTGEALFDLRPASPDFRIALDAEHVLLLDQPKGPEPQLVAHGRDGRIAWQVPAAGYAFASGQGLFLRRTDNTLAKLDPGTGATQWVSAPVGTDSYPKGVAANMLIVAPQAGSGSDPMIAIRLTDGAVAWRSELPAPGLPPTVVIAGDRVVVDEGVVPNTDDSLQILDARTGTKVLTERSVAKGPIAADPGHFAYFTRGKDGPMDFVIRDLP